MTGAVESQTGELMAAIAECAHLIVRERQASIGAVLESLGRSVQADRAVFMPVKALGPAPRQHAFAVEHEWISDREKVASLATLFGREPIPFVGRDYDFTRRLELLLEGRPVVYGSVRVLPENETSLANKAGTRSSVRVPVRAKGRLVGMIGLDHVRSVWPWRGDELHALWLAAELYGRALEDFADPSARAAPPTQGTSNRGTSLWVRHGIAFFGAAGWRAALPSLLRELGGLYDLRRATWWDEGFGAVRLAQEWHAEGIAPLPKSLRDPGAAADANTWRAWTERNRTFVTARTAPKKNLGHLVLQARREKGLGILPIGTLLQPLATLAAAAAQREP